MQFNKLSNQEIETELKKAIDQYGYLDELSISENRVLTKEGSTIQQNYKQKTFPIGKVKHGNETYFCYPTK